MLTVGSADRGGNKFGGRIRGRHQAWLMFESCFSKPKGSHRKRLRQGLTPNPRSKAFIYGGAHPVVEVSLPGSASMHRIHVGS